MMLHPEDQELDLATKEALACPLSTCKHFALLSKSKSKCKANSKPNEQKCDYTDTYCIAPSSQTHQPNPHLQDTSIINSRPASPCSIPSPTSTTNANNNHKDTESNNRDHNEISHTNEDADDETSDQNIQAAQTQAHINLHYRAKKGILAFCREEHEVADVRRWLWSVRRVDAELYKYDCDRNNKTMSPKIDAEAKTEHEQPLKNLNMNVHGRGLQYSKAYHSQRGAQPLHTKRTTTTANTQSEHNHHFLFPFPLISPSYHPPQYSSYSRDIPPQPTTHNRTKYAWPDDPSRAMVYQTFLWRAGAQQRRERLLEARERWEVIVAERRRQRKKVKVRLYWGEKGERGMDAGMGLLREVEVDRAAIR